MVSSSSGRAGAEVPPLKTEKKFFQLGAFAHLIRFFRIEGISLTHFSIILFSLITSWFWRVLTCVFEPPESWKSRFWNIDFDDSAEKFFTYTKHGFPCPRRFRSIKPNFSSSRSSRVALLSAQRKVLLTSSIVKMMNTRPFLSNHSFLTERLMRSSRMPYRVLASVDRSWNRCSWKRAFGMRKNEKSSPACP